MNIENYIFQLLYVVLFVIFFIEPHATIYGLIFGIGLSLLLKEIIQVPRPNNANSWGMPSTHSQTYMFLCIYLYFKGYNYCSFVILLLWCITFYYKVEFKDHSINQYILGGILGGILGVILNKN